MPLYWVLVTYWEEMKKGKHLTFEARYRFIQYISHME